MPVGVSRLRGFALLAGAGLALAACGGAGGPGPATVSAVAPAPTAAPVPQPASFDTPEYRRSSSAVSANVLPAWQAGASGAGVTIGFVDSGIDSDNPEFAGRILPASRDITGQGRGITDVSGHGTSIAAVAAAARNDSGVVGIAPAASLAIIRADNGDCTDGCRFADSVLAAGIDAAVAAGAKVINLSVGGSTGSGTLRSSYARATAAGVILVIAAGNDARADVDPLPAGALNAANRALVIVAGATDDSGTLADFSNRAGSAAANYLAARGTSVRSFDHTGTAYFFSGTSYSAPAIAAAAALLAQAFPTLSGAQIVELLLNNATDAGAPGTDSVYGRGILNIARAFAPSGQTSLAGTAVPVSLAATGSLGPAFGESLATGSGLAAVPVIDAYGRAYSLSLGPALRLASARRLAGRLEAAGLVRAETGGALGTFAARLELRATGHIDRPGPDAFRSADAGVAHLGFAQRGADARAGLLNPLRDTRLALTSGAVTLTAASGRLAGESLPGGAAGGFVTEDGLKPDEGTGTLGREMLMLETGRGPFMLAVAATSARTPLPRLQGLSRTARQDRLTLALAGHFGPLRLAARLTDTEDRGAFLGTRLDPGYGLLGGHSRTAGFAAELEQAGWGLRFAATAGRHTPRTAATGLLRADGALASRSWSATASAPLAAGRLNFSLARPLAITSGLLRLANGTAVEAAAPARETATELGYSRGGLSLAAFDRRRAGNIGTLRDSGAALSFRTAF
jgi:subtilisin family serine protease